MGFKGYLRFAGVELVNNARVDAYTDHLNLGFFNCTGTCPSLPDALLAAGWGSSGGYTTPKEDGAPWWDEAEPYGDGFAGVHVLDVSGFDGSTWSAQSSEALVDGGFVSRGRFATREMTFRVLLPGKDLLSVQHGFNWLSSVLHNGDPCNGVGQMISQHVYRDYREAPNKPWWTKYKDDDPTGDDDLFNGPLVTGEPQTYEGLRLSLTQRIPLAAVTVDDIMPCEGDVLEFFLRCPDAGNWQTLYRYHLDVHCTAGPTVLSSHELSDTCDGGAWAEVEFTITAANPFAFRRSIKINGSSDVFRYNDYPSLWDMYKNALPVSDDNMYEAPLLYRDVPHTYAGINEVLWRIVPKPARVAAAAAPLAANYGPVWTDPDCPPVAQFPGPPDEAAFLCAPLFAGTWSRTVYRVKTTKLPKFTEVVLVSEFTADDTDLKDVRVRLVPESATSDEDYISQFYIHYIPAGATLRLDGRRRAINMYTGRPGTEGFVFASAEHLVDVDTVASASHDQPILICGNLYRVLVDVPGDAPPVVRPKVQILAIGREG